MGGPHRDTKCTLQAFKKVQGGASVISSKWVLSAAHVFSDDVLNAGGEGGKNPDVLENFVFAAGNLSYMLAILTRPKEVYLLQ